jgi:hypothetical protein
MKKMLFLMLFITFGCTNKQEELNYLICKDSIQYWNYEWPRERAEYYGFTFGFNKNGTVKKYSYNKEKNKRWLFGDNRDPYNDKWSVTEDSIFKVMGDRDKIIRYTKDTIYVINIKYKIKGYYVKIKPESLNLQQ